MLTSPNQHCDLTEDAEIVTLRPSQRVALEEREDSFLEIHQSRDLEVIHAVRAASDRSYLEDRPQELQELRADLRDVERQADPPWDVPVVLSTDRDVEASLAVDEPAM